MIAEDGLEDATATIGPGEENRYDVEQGGRDGR